MKSGSRLKNGSLFKKEPLKLVQLPPQSLHVLFFFQHTINPTTKLKQNTNCVFSFLPLLEKSVQT
ncbi:hypothetical protein AT984_09715 [Paucibacter sp. KCTC 42545]|nr:hypothetical protein AT984_09715 [Paucibacter sp. KCTC 42545]